MKEKVVLKGEVISVHRQGCEVNVKGKIHFCLVRCQPNPVVNDIVTLEKREDRFFITQIALRKNFVARYDFYKEKHQIFAANIDTAFIVTSANKEFSVNRIGRFLALLDGGKMRKVIVLTKVDLAHGGCSSPDIKEYTDKLADIGAGVEHILINAKDRLDVFKLLDFIKPKGTALLMGSSGVGKSTIINTLCGLSLRTNDVQDQRLGNKGKHTTSARTMYYLPCGRRIIDTPGVKIVGLEGDKALRR